VFRGVFPRLARIPRKLRFVHNANIIIIALSINAAFASTTSSLAKNGDLEKADKALAANRPAARDPSTSLRTSEATAAV
jgi:hypothetical protein